MLDELTCGEKKVGYGPNEIRPFNLPELASFTTVLPELLTYLDRTQVHSLICTLNMFPASAVAGMTIWSLLAIHLAVSRTHQDHDGMGTCLTGRKGLKLWIFWPNMTHSQRQQFHVEGPGLCTAEPRYIILAPGDQFIQNPVQSQLVPAYRLTPFTSHHPCCKSHPHTLPTTAQRCLQRPHLLGRNS